MRNINTSQQRRVWLQKKLKLDLSNIGSFTFSEEKTKNRNIENMIGCIQVPLGIAGPLKIKYQKYKTRNFYLPLATTEGALVASINRGCKATRLSGGITTLIKEAGVTRGPVFLTSGILASRTFEIWLTKNFSILQNIVKKTSNHLSLTSFKIIIIGKNVYVRFYFYTHEAMGMNMATMATQKIVDFISRKTNIECLSLSGNYCVDKKPSWLNFINGRGKQAWAEAVLAKEIVKSVLKTTPEKITSVVKNKCYLGAIASGSLGFNSHFSNIIAGIFLATGQDMAHVVESSLGITTAELTKDKDLYFSIYLPDLMIGTVGGGTNLETQKEALAILGLGKAESGESQVFAEIISGAVLAGELSLLAALSAGDLAKAHEKLGRGLN